MSSSSQKDEFGFVIKQLGLDWFQMFLVLVFYLKISSCFHFENKKENDGFVIKCETKNTSIKCFSIPNRPLVLKFEFLVIFSLCYLSPYLHYLMILVCEIDYRISSLQMIDRSESQSHHNSYLKQITFCFLDAKFKVKIKNCSGYKICSMKKTKLDCNCAATCFTWPV